MLRLEVRDMRDARDERTDGGTTTGVSVRGANTCRSSELLDETDYRASRGCMCTSGLYPIMHARL